MSVVVAIDVSHSMRGEPLERARAAALELLESIGPRDRIAVVSFADRVEVVAPFDAPKSEARGAMERVAAAEESEKTLLYDGVHKAVELIRSGVDLPRRAFAIVLSDGYDARSEHPLEEVIEFARGDETRPPVPTFTIGDARFGSDRLAVLELISGRTGAIHLPATSTIHISSFFGEIWRQMTKSYVLRYPGELDGERHEVAVEIEGHAARRAVRYPSVRPALWPYAAIALLAALAGVVTLSVGRRRSRGRLVFEGGPTAGDVYVVRKPRTRVGALADNDLVIPADTVSKHHLLVRHKGAELEIEDLNSSNGTYVNGVRIQTSPIRPGDRIRVADVDLVFQR